MKLLDGHIEYIIDLANDRKMRVVERVGIKSKYCFDDLKDPTGLDIELFDSIDCLSPDELKELLDAAMNGGMRDITNLPISDKVDELFREIDLGVILQKGCRVMGI